MQHMRIVFLSTALLCLTLLIPAVSHAGVVYSEDFSTSVVWNATWTPGVGESHGVQDGAYNIRIEDGSNIDKWAYKSWSETLDNVDFQIEFDFKYTEMSVGQPIAIAWKLPGDDWANTPLTLHHDLADNNIRLREGSTTFWGPTPSVDVWYHFNLLYDVHSGLANWSISLVGDGSIFWEEIEQDFAPAAFNKIGIGTTVFNGEGAFSGLAIDNIVISTYEIVTNEEKTFSALKSLYR